jgi:hypothetical protein
LFISLARPRKVAFIVLNVKPDAIRRINPFGRLTKIGKISATGTPRDGYNNSAESSFKIESAGGTECANSSTGDGCNRFTDCCERACVTT